MKKKLIKNIFSSISLAIFSGVYKRSFLTGRHFTNNAKGWKWCWRSVVFQKIFGFNRDIPWPVSPFNHISSANNIEFHPDDLNNFQTFGCYFQNSHANIVIGRGSYIAPNVGIITANHDPLNLDQHILAKDVIIGERCWIGMNSVIMPGVQLGPNTVVGAGSVVTKSFAEGFCIIAGSPARKIRDLEINGSPN